MPLIPVSTVALPSITTVAEAADYQHAFGQFLPQLYTLPNQIYASAGDANALRQLYIATNPAVSGLALAIALCPIFLIVSEVNRNWSQVDRVWSILPTVWNVHYALWARLSGLPTSRVDNVLAFSVVWTIRLTFNYWRRGGYQIGSEDYRWNLIKERIGSVAFFLLNVTFTSSMQVVLLWSITLPTYLILLASIVEPKMSGIDVVLGRTLIALVVVEWFADQQQWDYHQAKHEYQKTAKVPAGWTRAQLDRGFNTTGLWKYSRHPNFAAEQSIWIVVYQWGCFATNTMFNWSVVGVIGYVLVFQGSTPLTEAISSSKYPEYKLYQQRVGKFVPTLFGKGWSEAEIEKSGQGEKKSARKEQ